MNETERLAKVKTALRTAVIKVVEAEGFLEDAAGYAEPTSEKAEQIWQLKQELDRLGCRIIELLRA